MVSDITDVQGPAEDDSGAPVHELFAARAARHPDALAVRAPDGSLTYGELEQRSNQLAHRLIALGVRPETPVGLCLERSAALVVAALGILKAGCAYVALDPSYPEDRLRFMLEDSAAQIVVGPAAVVAPFVATVANVLVLDGSWGALDGAPAAPPPTAAAVGGAALAYVIYTSGSTGRPKGVLVEHASLLNLVWWHRRAFSITERDRATQIASPGFDAVVWELWPYLTAGASIHVPYEGLRTDPPALRDWLVEQRITVSFIPTAIAEEMLRLDWPMDSSLRQVLTGGDALRSHAPAGLPFQLVNNYGPAEATVVATSGVVPASDSGGSARAPSIGRPITGVRVHIVDENMNPVRSGQPGEMLIGGAGVARGYLNQPEMTAERFLPDIYSGEREGRLYRSGDIVRSRPDGDIEFVGRLDEQVKIRGQRVELGEVSTTLNHHPAVRAGVVIAARHARGQTRLVACVVPDDSLARDAGPLRAHLAATLPEHMVPTEYLWLDELPMTASDKVDRRALEALVAQRHTQSEVIDAPQNELEEALVGIVSELLGTPAVGVKANFFLLGGHSLLGAQLIARIDDRFGIELPLREIFEKPTVAEIAAAIEAQLVADLEGMSEEEAELLAGGLVGESVE